MLCFILDTAVGPAIIQRQIRQVPKENPGVAEPTRAVPRIEALEYGTQVKPG